MLDVTTLFHPSTSLDLILDADIPVLSGRQVQGDVIFLPTDEPSGLGTQVKSVPLVEGAHTHQLVSSGTVYMTGDIVTVTEGSVGYIIHEEHPALGLAPGSYEVRRQVEGPREARRQVAD